MQQLTRPFRASEALTAGRVTRDGLHRRHVLVYPGVWVGRDVELTARLRAEAAWHWSRRQGVLTGLSASAVHGAKWIDAGESAELVHTNRRTPAGLVVHADTLLPGEVTRVAGMRLTTPQRTVFDLSRRLKGVAAVQRIDALMNATQIKAEDVEPMIAAHPRVWGLGELRRTLPLVDGGAESPYESLTRYLLVQRGFPKPETQIVVLDEYGEIFAVLDMGWREYGVGVDFDGAHHWTDSRRRNWDVERYGYLPELGWIDIRVSAGILHNRVEWLYDRVGAALISRGCPKTW